MALQETTLLGIMIVFSGYINSVFTAQNVCKTYGSGIFETFSNTAFHLKSTCPVTLTRFTHAGVDCHIIIQRGPNGLMDRVEIIVNKVITFIHNNTLTVEGSRISLPYDHTYQHVFHYGIYTKLRSKLLPLSVTWYNVSDGVSLVRVQMDQDLVEGMSGLCGHQNSSETMQQLIFDNVVSDGKCLTQDSVDQSNEICREVMSHARDCLGNKYSKYKKLCHKNMHGIRHREANCSFFKELSMMCGSSSPLWTVWRSKSNCSQPKCPGDLQYIELGHAFPPTCTNPQPFPEITSTCLPAQGKVLNDRIDGYHSIHEEDCPCVHARITYLPGQKRRTKCQTCTCIRGKWSCSANTCPPKCIIEGQFITTFDGKQYSLPDRCTYVAARGLNWTLNIQFSGQAVNIEKTYLNINQERYTFSANSVQLNNIDISDLSQTESTTVFWQSSMFIQVQTSFGLKMQVQVSPEIQIYLNLPPDQTTKGLCGTFNNDTSDDFTTFSGIVESSVQLFTQSWSMDSCAPIPTCISTDNEIFAEENCDKLRDLNGVFAVCHDFVPVSPFVEACVQRTCQCTSALKECLCISFGNYAKACAAQGIIVDDWRMTTNCLHSCQGNLRFGYTTLACNHTCRSVSGPDPTCEVVDDPVEGCSCISGTYLNNQHSCSPHAFCNCHHPGGVVPPGPVVIGRRQCMCENGQLRCVDVCDCPVGKICMDCSQIPVNTAYRTCESLTKPLREDNNCISGCYCPEGLFEDHNGGCVTHDNCTCQFSGRVYLTGQSVETNCKICTCRGGEWSCIDEACSGACEVFGNGQYRTFDSKWYRFDGHCQYTLVKDAASGGHGQFAIKTESVPCCDESLTCSRAISVELLGEVILILSDMKVSERPQAGITKVLQAEPLYFISTVGLYIIISVPGLGITVIWDKHTRVTIQLESRWRGRVLGLCGNFDGKVTNDLLTSSSSEVFSARDFGNSWKTAAPPCSDVMDEIFPCERHSYCAAWAQRRCMILRSDTFLDCHLKVDPEPYYQACVLESCSCEFEGKFLGFCTAVAAYAEACNAKDVCINWRTPDLCPVYCDYYNEEGQCSWHYDPCGQVKTCGTNNLFTAKLEGCYPRCPAKAPYYDENTAKCSTLDNCTCHFMNRVLTPLDEVCTPYRCCKCLKGNIVCISSTTTTSTSTFTNITKPTTTTQSTTMEPTTTKPPTTMKPTTQMQPSGKTKQTTSMEPTTPTPPTTLKPTTTTEPPTSQSTTQSDTATTERTTTTKTTTMEPTTTTQPTTLEHTTTTEPPPSQSTTLSDTTTAEHTTTTQSPTSGSTTQSDSTTTEHTTTTQPPTSESTMHTDTTTTEPTSITKTITMEPTTTTQTQTSGITKKTTSVEPTTPTPPTTLKPTTTTEPPTSQSTTQSDTATTTTKTTTMEPTTTTQLTTLEHTTTTEPPPSQSTTQSDTTTTEHTTTTQSPTSGSTTQSDSTSLESTTTTTTKTTTMEPTTTTQPTTLKPTTTTEQPTSQSTTQSDTATTERTTTTKTTTVEPTTTTQLTTLEHTTTTEPPPSQSTTQSDTTTTEHTTTTQSPTSGSTTQSDSTSLESTTTTTTKTTTMEPTTTTQPTTLKPTTTTEQPTSQSTTQSDTATTERTTTTKTTTVEPTTTTQLTTLEHTTTTEPPPSQSTTQSDTTTTEHTTTTQSPTSGSTTQSDSTSLESTTTTKTTTMEPTTTTQPTTLKPTTTTEQPTSQSTTQSDTATTERTTTTKTTTVEPTTTTQLTTLEHTTTTEPPPSQSTTQSDTTTTEHTTTTQSPTSGSTTQSDSTSLESTTTTKTTTMEPKTTTTQPTTLKPTTTTEQPTSKSTTQSHTTLTDRTTTAQSPTSQSTTQSYSTTVEPTTTTKTTTMEPTTTTQPATLEPTTTKEPPTSQSTTQSDTSTMERTTTTQSPTSQSTTQSDTTTAELTTTTKTGFTIITGPENSNATTGPQINLSVTSVLSSTISPTEHTTPVDTTTIKMTTTTPSVTSVTISTMPPTEHTTPVDTTTVKLTTMTSSSTSVLSTTPVCECKDVMRNKSWPCGATWIEDCADKACTAGVIEVKPFTCPALEDRTDCPGDKKSLVKNETTCCESWQCDCQCQLYGDPHYISFQGVAFDFLDNCTYTLVEERVLIHHLSITVDNYFCEPDFDASCAKGITLQYSNDTVTLMTVVAEDTEESMVESTLNQEIIKPPYDHEVFRFESNGGQVYVYIKPIRSYVSLTPFNTLVVNLAREHFLNNTQGQCGVCGGQSCIRRNGVVEKDYCCDKTAYDWVVKDPLKPYCKSPPQEFSCIHDPPTPPPPCYAPICDLLQHEVFAECSKIINLTSVENNCRFDHCLTNSSCSSLEYAASECKRIGICVHWRPFTNGLCEVKCPEGMIYDECRQTPNDVCQGGMRVPATSVVNLRSGCFCPDGQALAEEHKQICLHECPYCKGPLGEPMPVGSVWESNCHICKCNNQTKTEECRPKATEPSPVCSPNSLLVSDCCNNQICVEKTCEYNGTTYKVGDSWKDPSRPCESFSCSETGTEVERRICPLQTCAEDSREWDKHHCCYTCNVNCTARMTRMNVTVANCTQEVELPSCEGQCETHHRWVQSHGTLQLEQDHKCCKERSYEMREIKLTCRKNNPTHFTYRHITGCECKM